MEAISRFSEHRNSCLARADADTLDYEANSLRDTADIKRFISETFNETGLVIPYRQPGFSVSPLGVTSYCVMQAITDTRTKVHDSSGKQTSNRVSLVVCQHIQSRPESEDLTT
jgi:hypothetical protein